LFAVLLDWKENWKLLGLTNLKKQPYMRKVADCANLVHEQFSGKWSTFLVNMIWQWTLKEITKT
jgi:hypothetical protein